MTGRSDERFCLRNRLSGFLSWKYGQSWIYQDQRMLRQSTQPDRTQKSADRSAMTADEGACLTVRSTSWRHLASTRRALYPTPQAWEICLRNRLSGFLSWKYGQSWIYQDQRRSPRTGRR
jgi:hypothetical protein